MDYHLKTVIHKRLWVLWEKTVEILSKEGLNGSFIAAKTYFYQHTQT